MHPRDVRASDLDRERAVEFLKANYAAGRLQHDELAWRSDSAYRAVRLAELDWLASDLPAVVPPARRRRGSFLPLLVLGALVAVLLMALPPHAWLMLFAIAAVIGLVAFVVVAPIAVPVLLLAFVAHLIARAVRPRHPQPRHVGWR
jgi:Domain of unknown function (DUF1707)